MSKITLTIGKQSIVFSADDAHFVAGAVHEALSHATGSSKYTGRDGLIYARLDNPVNKGIDHILKVSSTKMVDSTRAGNNVNSAGEAAEILTDC